MLKSTLSNAEERALYPRVEKMILDMLPNDLELAEAFLASARNDHELHLMRAELTAGTIKKIEYHINKLRREAQEKSQ